MQPDADIQQDGLKTPAEVQSFTAKYWWLNFVRGIAALFLGLGLLVPVEVILQVDRVQAMLFQFIGIYLLLSGIMSLIWGFSNRRRLGIWILAGALGLAGGIAFFFWSFLESHLPSSVLTIIFGLIMLLIGSIHLLGGFRLSETYGRRWSWGHEFLGLVEILIGLLIFVSLFVTVDNLRIILSFWGIVAGIGLVADGVRIRKQKISLEAAQASRANGKEETI